MENFLPNPKLKLREQLGEVMRFRQMSPRTESSYWHWIKGYILFHQKRHPREMHAAEVQAYLTHLAAERDVAAATQNQALMFIYTQVLERQLGPLGKFAWASRPVRLPVGLTPAGVRSLLAEMTKTHLLARRLVVVISWKIEVVFQGQRVV